MPRETTVKILNGIFDSRELMAESVSGESVSILLHEWCERYERDRDFYMTPGWPTDAPQN